MSRPVERPAGVDASGSGRDPDGPAPGAQLIRALRADVLQALEAVQVPAFAIDDDRRIRWQNAAAFALVGDLRGRLDGTIVAPEDLAPVRDAFARERMGALHTEYEATVVRADGGRVRLAMSSVPLRVDGRVIGSFALAREVAQAEPAPEPSLRLTPRQLQTLTLLAAGCSTPQMAGLMGLSEETVRNHVKRLLRNLAASSRLEAVAKARDAGVI
jgi:PAS domain S-box-containing protein